MSMLWMRGGHVALASAVKDCGIVEYGAISPPVAVGKLSLYWISLLPRARHTCEEPSAQNPPSYRTGSHILPLLHITSNPPSHTRTLQVSGRTPLELWCISQGRCDTRRIRATKGMPKRKTFNRPALLCTSTRTNLEGRRSLELRNLPFQPCPREPRAGVLVAIWRLPIGTDIVPHIYIFVFKYVTV